LGLVHAGRIYFFAGESEREKFRAHPSFYARGDLANFGNCLVIQIDEGKVVAGLPETTAIVNGLRYFFAGDYQRRLFASDPSHYGVKRIVFRSAEEQPILAASPQARKNESKSQQESRESGATRLPGQELEEPEEQHYAMEGYCPVSIQTQGIWVRGSYQNHVDYAGKRYLLAGAKEKKLFQDDPQKYMPALGGDCIVSKTDQGELRPGSVYHSVIFEERLYLFAGPEEVKAFKADPAKYVQAAAEPAEPEAPHQADAIPADEQESTGNILREGRRSEFRGSGLGR
jgi:YHS domain-containing protein